ncbi:MAG: hypothetical protein AAB932_00250 [Patescibacteria group bacterium]
MREFAIIAGLSTLLGGDAGESASVHHAENKEGESSAAAEKTSNIPAVDPESETDVPAQVEQTASVQFRNSEAVPVAGDDEQVEDTRKNNNGLEKPKEIYAKLFNFFRDSFPSYRLKFTGAKNDQAAYTICNENDPDDCFCDFNMEEDESFSMNTIVGYDRLGHVKIEKRNWTFDEFKRNIKSRIEVAEYWANKNSNSAEAISRQDQLFLQEHGIEEIPDMSGHEVP